MSEFTCGKHTAEVFGRGGVAFVGTLTPLTEVHWNRVRDDISTASVYLPTNECCELIAQVRSMHDELHLFRDGQPVWQGVITRIEYESDICRIFAEDMLWVAKRKVLQVGYSHAYPNIGYSIDRADWLLRQQCFNPLLDGDPWLMQSHVHRMTPLGAGPKTARAVAAYEMTIWQDFDKYAEDYGLDYVVINRDIYFWDHGVNWLPLPPLSEAFLSETARLVEYGNDGFTRGFVSNALGYAGVAVAPSPWPETYTYIDSLTTNIDDSGDLTTKLKEKQDKVTEANKQLLHNQEEYNKALATEAASKADSELKRARADLAKSYADQADAKTDNDQFLANEWQRWADLMQSQASETGTKALNDQAKADQKAAEQAARDAEAKKELLERQREIATNARAVANLSGLPSDNLVAEGEEGKVDDYQDDFDAAQANAVFRQGVSDASWAAAKATNDASLQAQADAIQDGADAAEEVVRVDKLDAIALEETAKAVEKIARDAESDYARDRGRSEAWLANIAESYEDINKAWYGVHGVPGEDEVDGVYDVINEINAAIVVWSETAAQNLVGHYPPPLAIVLPANTTLLPGSGWTVDHLVPGGIFSMTIERLCRQATNSMMIDEVRVDETARDGEKVQITATTIGAPVGVA